MSEQAPAIDPFAERNARLENTNAQLAHRVNELEQELALRAGAWHVFLRRADGGECSWQVNPDGALEWEGDDGTRLELRKG